MRLWEKSIQKQSWNFYLACRIFAGEIITSINNWFSWIVPIWNYIVAVFWTRKKTKSVAFVRRDQEISQIG